MGEYLFLAREKERSRKEGALYVIPTAVNTAANGSDLFEANPIEGAL